MINPDTGAFYNMSYYNKTQKAEINRMLTGPDSHYIEHMACLQGVFFDELDRSIVCNGCTILRLVDKLDGFPTVAGIDVNPVFEKAIYDGTEERLLTLPTRTELKKFLADCRAKGVSPIYDFGAGKPSVDGRKLLGVLITVPKCRAWAGSAFASPLYFTNDKGDEALLYPVRKRDT